MDRDGYERILAAEERRRPEKTCWDPMTGERITPAEYLRRYPQLQRRWSMDDWSLFLFALTMCIAFLMYVAAELF